MQTYHISLLQETDKTKNKGHKIQLQYFYNGQYMIDTDVKICNTNDTL